MEYYFECYGEIGLQREMVSDAPRTDAFAAAIKDVVKEGDRVLDVGTGTGLLAMLAAKAGAAKAYGVDQSDIAELAKLLIEKNGLEERVEIINGNAKDFQLDEPVDLLVSEWLGYFAFAEAMLDDVLAARDKNLKPGGRMLPSGVEIWLAPISAAWTYEAHGPGYWKEPIHGLDYSALEEMELKQGYAGKTDVPEESLLAAGQSLLSLDLAIATSEDPWQNGELTFVIEEDGTLDGFAGWFTAQLSPSVILDTSPAAPMTHWSQTHFMFPPREVEKGQVLKVAYSLARHGKDPRSLAFTLTADGETIAYTVG